MQSTNEELETSKEELQSINEELNTVNVRLSEKVDELDETNSDLRNLFESTEIATVFLDRHLIIRSFTPAIATLYNLDSERSGPSLERISPAGLDYRSIARGCGSCPRDAAAARTRIARRDRSAHYIMRILPYREPDSTVSGVAGHLRRCQRVSCKRRSALREADLRKDVFLATLSHELRNPLAPIRTAAQIARRASDCAASTWRESQGIISRQVIHMSSLLDDLLDVSRITRGAFRS